jgi:hypothetical protein
MRARPENKNRLEDITTSAIKDDEVGDFFTAGLSGCRQNYVPEEQGDGRRS